VTADAMKGLILDVYRLGRAGDGSCDSRFRELNDYPLPIHEG
jgi:hypothetical protein